jgi:carbamoyltransferase
MLLVAPVRPERRTEANGTHSYGEDLLRIVNQTRSDIPAVTHVDYSARVQTVKADSHPDFHRIIRAFYDKTNCPVIVNTSFNVRGEPIVCSPQDAYRCFMRTDLDLLVLEDCLVWKQDQPPLADDDDWRSEYELD